LPIATYSGLRKSARLINYGPETAVLIVLFKETAMPSFFKQPLHELFGGTVALDSFFSQTELSAIEEQLAEAPNNAAKITVVERFLYSKLSYRKPDHLVAEALARIYSKNGMTRINDLAADLFISQDAFEKRFRKVTGATPKQFSAIVKMKSIVSQKAASSSLLDLALENGYYDQSHFNKDFKLFTGQTPTDFFKSTLYW
jgi:AraC-like DNA-binding protein